LQAVAQSSTSKESPSPIEKFLAVHPAASAFVKTPKPTPASFATETYFGVTAMRFTNKDGASRYGRYRIVPEAGAKHLSAEEAKTKETDFLFNEIQQRLESGPARFRIMVQLANKGDVVDDATVHWPEDRETAQFGTISLTKIALDNAHEQQRIIFDPIPRIDGIDPSDDPLLELRAAVYLISGRRRRNAPQPERTASVEVAAH
jgi:catalase